MNELQILLQYIFLVYRCMLYYPYIIIMRSSMFPCSNVHVMNAYVDNVCILDYDTNNPKGNLSPTFPVPYPNIYTIVVPKPVRYVNTSYFIILFAGVVHA